MTSQWRWRLLSTMCLPFAKMPQWAVLFTFWPNKHSTEDHNNNNNNSSAICFGTVQTRTLMCLYYLIHPSVHEHSGDCCLLLSNVALRCHRLVSSCLNTMWCGRIWAEPPVLGLYPFTECRFRSARSCMPNSLFLLIVHLHLLYSREMRRNHHRAVALVQGHFLFN